MSFSFQARLVGDPRSLTTSLYGACLGESGMPVVGASNRCKKGDWAYKLDEDEADRCPTSVTQIRYPVLCTSAARLPSVAEPRYVITVDSKVVDGQFSRTNTYTTENTMLASQIPLVGWLGGSLIEQFSIIPGSDTKVFATSKAEQQKLCSQFENRPDAPISSVTYTRKSLFGPYSENWSIETGTMSDGYLVRKAATAAANVLAVRTAMLNADSSSNPLVDINTPEFNERLMPEFAFTAALPGRMRAASMGTNPPDITFIELETVALNSAVDPEDLLSDMREAGICSKWGNTPVAASHKRKFCTGKNLLTGICLDYCNQAGSNCDLALTQHCATADTESNAMCACYKGETYYTAFAAALKRIFPEATDLPTTTNPECMYPPCSRSKYPRNAFQEGKISCDPNITRCLNVDTIDADGNVLVAGLTSMKATACASKFDGVDGLNVSTAADPVITQPRSRPAPVPVPVPTPAPAPAVPIVPVAPTAPVAAAPVTATAPVAASKSFLGLSWKIWIGIVAGLLLVCGAATLAYKKRSVIVSKFSARKTGGPGGGVSSITTA